MTDALKSKLISVLESIIEKWLFIIPIFYFIIIILNYRFSTFQYPLKEYFVQFSTSLSTTIIPKQLNALTTVSAVLIGFYVATMSVFGTSISNAILKISKGNKVRSFIEYSCNALSSAFIFLLYSIFLDAIKNKFFNPDFYFVIFLWMIIAAIRFAALVILMYHDNITNATKVIKNDQNVTDRIVALLTSLETFLRYSNSQNIELMEKIKEQRTKAPDIPK